jgi:hypothetical protein
VADKDDGGGVFVLLPVWRAARDADLTVKAGIWWRRGSDGCWLPAKIRASVLPRRLLYSPLVFSFYFFLISSSRVSVRSPISSQRGGGEGEVHGGP